MALRSQVRKHTCVRVRA
ncbi:hypothetical protein E2C01_048449 [Portunus trituberculatus]|uniref:Uncharacterized protein n=1 Tax=Portunus trituberculatus TaxID=210409 RepID=A0A5B7GBM5_PORTR|nr:hypothetical protein [Portunus trituberculatus]